MSGFIRPEQFYNSEIFEQADSASFEIINNHFSKDKNNVFHDLEILDIADPKSFKVLKHGYLIDKKHVFYNLKVLATADPITFQIIDWPYSKDKDHVFRHSNILKKADPSSFQLIGDHYAKDNNYVFYYDDILDNISSIGFRTINEYYAINTDNVIYDRKVLENTDPDTFEILTNEYSKDKNNVYYRGGKLNNISPNSFRVLENHTQYTVNKDHVFFDQNTIKDADPKTFKRLSHPYSKDDNSSFYLDKKIDNANPKSFQILDYPYSKDESSVFYQDKKIDQADPNTFRVLNNEFSVDNNHIYYREYLVDNMTSKMIDRETIQIIDGKYAMDKRRIYSLFSIQQDIPQKLEKIKPKVGIALLNRIGSHTSKLHLPIQTPKREKLFYYKDDSNVFASRTDSYNDLRGIKNADPLTFAIHQFPFATDKNSVFYFGLKIEGLSSEGFEVIDSHLELAKNHNQLIHRGKAIYGFDVDNIRVIKPTIFSNCPFLLLVNQQGQSYYADNAAFYWGKIISLPKGIKPDEIVLPVQNRANCMQHPFFPLAIIKDNNHVYYANAKAKENKYFKINYPQLDAKSVEILNRKAIKDKNGLHYINEISVITPITKYLEEGELILGYKKASDRNKIYYEDEPIHVFSPNTFQIILTDDGYPYSAEDRYVNYRDGRIHWIGRGKEFESPTEIGPAGRIFDNEFYLPIECFDSKDNPTKLFECYQSLVYPELWPTNPPMIPENFKILGKVNEHWYIRDNHYVLSLSKNNFFIGSYPSKNYVDLMKILDVSDPATFEIIDEKYAQDKNGRYLLKELHSSTPPRRPRCGMRLRKIY